jgi:Phosphotransferase enzyme family
MSENCPIPGADDYRLVFLRARSLLTFQDGFGLRLPRLVISRGTRPVEQLQRSIKETWQLDAIILELLCEQNNSKRLAIVEILASESCSNMSTASLDQVSKVDLNATERSVIERIMVGLHGSGRPFARLGWMEDALAWLRTEAPEEASSTLNIRQFNAGGTFALIRFDFHRGATFWMKATGEPNRHEFYVTRKLAQVCPEFLPPRIAEREDWNAWLMKDAGIPLESWRLSAVELALHSMSTLQQSTIGQTDQLIAQGAFDQRVHVLREHLTELVEYIRVAMRSQTSTKVPQIEPDRLSQLEGILRDACFRLEDLEIPDTVIHNDINPGNVLFNGARCVFTDWCETGIGNPFFTLHHLCRLRCDGRDRSISNSREIYEKCWVRHLTEKQIDLALPLIPLLTILSYFYGRGTWLKSPQCTEPHFESYARSLARHMDRAAQDPELLEALCR